MPQPPKGVLQLTLTKNQTPEVVQSFFYRLCAYSLNDIRLSLLHGRVEYDELVSELYMYLSQDSWRKLDTFAGLNSCSLKTWMARLSWRFFNHERQRLLGSQDTCQCDENRCADFFDGDLEAEVKMDVDWTLQRMPNRRYAQVIGWMMVEGREAEEVAQLLEVALSNVYNIKHRAIAQFVKVYSDVR